MPLTRSVLFKAVVQKGRRIQIPRLVRWQFKLDPGEVFHVTVWLVGRIVSESFYAKMTSDGRITIPKLEAGIFAAGVQKETLIGCVVSVRLSPVEQES